MNRTREIERPEWSGFFDGFSRQHEGWLVTVEQVSMPRGPSAVEARELPLEGVSADPDGTDQIGRLEFVLLPNAPMVNSNRNRKNQPPTGEGKHQSRHRGQPRTLGKRSEVFQAQRHHPELNLGET